MDFKLITNFTPTGDQPNAIESLIRGVENNEKYQTLLGVTGSEKPSLLQMLFKNK